MQTLIAEPLQHLSLKYQLWQNNVKIMNLIKRKILTLLAYHVVFSDSFVSCLMQLLLSSTEAIFHDMPFLSTKQAVDFVLWFLFFCHDSRHHSVCGG